MVHMASIIYSTVGSEEEAKHIAHTLIKEKLVACVNIIPEITSIYRWEGVIEEDSEFIMIAKTTEKNAEKTVARINELHSYELPDIIVIPIIAGLKEYIQYIEDETA